jgi:transcriptional regulator with GAF, ATPase, and Fis domain
MKISSLIAVPMMWMNRIYGVLCLFTADVEVLLDEDHLQLASTIAAIGAVAMEGLCHLESLQQDHVGLIEDLRITHSMIGETAVMKELYSLLGRVAPADSTVLICGESGTGKELAARAIHLNSPRCGKSFVAINCANLSETLLESELFGYEKGAFTGAHAQKKGKIESAHGGTLFLDEIAELAPSLQARLLRVLQEREFERLGGTRPIRVDMRMIAATNQNLQERLRAGTFRQDLYYRLNVVQIDLPPLRDRKEDIPLLASYFPC